MALRFQTIEIEEIPSSDQHLHPASILPSSIFERDDPRTIIYIIQDEQPGQDVDIDLAAAIAEHRQQQQQQAETAALRRLESVMDEELILDAIGRRILAANGHDVPDLWHPYHPYHHLHPSLASCHYHHQPYGAAWNHHLYRFHPYSSSAIQLRNTAGGHDFIHSRHASASDSASLFAGAGRGQGRDASAAFNPFIHAAPLIFNADRTASPEARGSHDNQPRTQGRGGGAGIAIHPITGLPVLFSRDPDFYGDGDNILNEPKQSQQRQQGETGHWDDDSDIDWLGRELLLRERGAPVWILDADLDKRGAAAAAAATEDDGSGGQTTMGSSRQPGTPMRSFQVTEYDEDEDDDGDAASSLGRLLGRRDIHALASALAEASRASPQPQPQEEKGQRTPAEATAASAAAVASTDGTPEAGSSVGRASTPPRAAAARSRSRAATVMSESEEEELETVGKVEVDEAGAGGGEGRPSKAVKVVDTRTGGGAA